MVLKEKKKLSRQGKCCYSFRKFSMEGHERTESSSIKILCFFQAVPLPRSIGWSTPSRWRTRSRYRRTTRTGTTWGLKTLWKMCLNIPWPLPFRLFGGYTSSSHTSSSSVVSSSLLVGTVQRKDVDTFYTCLASNSNMTQASRAEVRLQMNCEWRLTFFFHFRFRLFFLSFVFSCLGIVYVMRFPGVKRGGRRQPKEDFRWVGFAYKLTWKHSFPDADSHGLLMDSGSIVQWRKCTDSPLLFCTQIVQKNGKKGKKERREWDEKERFFFLRALFQDISFERPFLVQFSFFLPQCRR